MTRFVIFRENCSITHCKVRCTEREFRDDAGKPQGEVCTRFRNWCHHCHKRVEIPLGKWDIRRWPCLHSQRKLHPIGRPVRKRGKGKEWEVFFSCLKRRPRRKARKRAFLSRQKSTIYYFKSLPVLVCLSTFSNFLQIMEKAEKYRRSFSFLNPDSFSIPCPLFFCLLWKLKCSYSIFFIKSL